MTTTKRPFAAVEPRKVPVQKRSRERFELILGVTLELIKEKGMDTVPMSDIAEAAQISVASLYQYFPEKATIVATLAQRFNQEGQECVRGCFQRLQSPTQLQEALEDMAEGYFQFFAEVEGSYTIWQATQSDWRLQKLDRQDIEAHVETIAKALKFIFPNLSLQGASTQSRMLVSVVGSGVREASRFPHSEGREMLDFLKSSIIAPACRKLLDDHARKE